MSTHVETPDRDAVSRYIQDRVGRMPKSLAVSSLRSDSLLAVCLPTGREGRMNIVAHTGYVNPLVSRDSDAYVVEGVVIGHLESNGAGPGVFHVAMRDPGLSTYSLNARLAPDAKVLPVVSRSRSYREAVRALYGCRMVPPAITRSA